MREKQPILLVEDDLSLRDSLCAFLQAHGYATLTAATARAGWELIRNRRPAVCLIDLNLPDGSGLDLVKKIVRQGAKTRVVVMTAFDLANMRPAGADEVLVGWMTKPVHPDELLTMVEKALAELESTAPTDE
jgi:DNA-binding response OmpR family regulator